MRSSTLSSASIRMHISRPMGGLGLCVMSKLYVVMK